MDIQQQKKENLLNAFKRNASSLYGDRSLSIIPNNIGPEPTFAIQPRPYFEINISQEIYSKDPIKGAPFVFFFPEGHMRWLMPFLDIMVNLLEASIPFLIMPYNGKAPYFCILDKMNLKAYHTSTPEKLLEYLQKDCMYDWLPDSFMTDTTSFIKDYIKNKKTEIVMPIDMSLAPNHETYKLI